jgi:hypothetical protein
MDSYHSAPDGGLVALLGSCSIKSVALWEMFIPIGGREKTSDTRLVVANKGRMLIEGQAASEPSVGALPMKLIF